MTFPPTPKVKTSILVALLMVFGSAGNVCFSAGMKQIGALDFGSIAVLHAAFTKIFFNFWIWTGIVSMLLYFAALMLVLSWADFSYVLPASAGMYVIIPLLGHFLLNETVTGVHWLGIGLIFVGVMLVSRTPASTTHRVEAAPGCPPACPAKKD
jgi:uncharacterized membrane protein